MKRKVIITVFVLTCLLSLNAFALNGLVDSDGKLEKVEASKYMGDTLWVLVAAFLVFFMQAGFAMVESGFTRAKNAVNILMKNLMDFSMGSVAYWAIGFAIMFGAGNAFMGTSGWFVPSETLTEGAATDTSVFSALEWSSVPTYAAWLFQLVFAATAATIVSGAMAERTQFKSYLIYSIFITGIIYPDCWTLDLGRWLVVRLRRGYARFCRFNSRPFHRRLARINRCYRFRTSYR